MKSITIDWKPGGTSHGGAKSLVAARRPELAPRRRLREPRVRRPILTLNGQISARSAATRVELNARL